MSRMKSFAAALGLAAALDLRRGLRRRPRKLQDGPPLRCRLDRHPGHHGRRLRAADRARLRAGGDPAFGARHLRVAEEQRPRRLPRQLDAVDDQRHQGLHGRRFGRDDQRRTSKAPATAWSCPTYVAEAGVKTLTDIGKFKDKFDGKIYGIEAGNDGNRIILDMISKPESNLEGFELVESSEAGMLTQAEQSMKNN